MYRIGNNIFPGDTAQTINDIKLSFMTNESPLKMGYMSITDNLQDDQELDTDGTVGI